MNREQLLDLTSRVREVAGVEIPIIVGSQSIYGVTSQVPEIVKLSVEGDFLLTTAGAEAFKAVIEQIGFASAFQETFGYYADALGLATVVLTAGWSERLLQLNDDGGKLVAYCLEIHDTCVAKLMAGREKDFAFIKAVVERGLADTATFAERASLVSEMPQAAALLPRLESLQSYLEGSRATMKVGPLWELALRLRGR